MRLATGAARRVAVLALLVLVAGPGRPLAAAEVSVAAASDLKFAMDPLLEAFRGVRPDVGLKVAYGSSGSFFAQIEAGAPFDVFLSADADYPRKLAAAGKTLDGEVFLYAVGRIAVFVPDGSAVDPRALGIKALLDPSVKRVAIANPRHAPYGRAAEAALRSLGVLPAVQEKLVLGESIAQVAQLLEAGAADAGILALSLVLAPQMAGKGRSWVIPLDAYPPLEQGGAVLAGARDPAAARAVRDFLIGPAARQILDRFGFLPPGRKAP